MKNSLLTAALLLLLSTALHAQRVVIAYVTSRPGDLPDPTYLTHINYAFGHVNETFDGVLIENPDRLKEISALKKQYPDLKVLLSIGGWGSGRFSEMAADEVNRWKFAKDCRRTVRKFHLDGIDIDWEYPTSNAAGISCSKEDTENYTLLMRDLRKALGPKKLLTHATVSSAQYMDFVAVDEYVNFTNVMTYDLGWAPYLNSPLYPSEHTDSTSVTASEGIQRYLDLGLPAEKIVMGLAFYGRGVKGFKRPDDLTRVHEREGYDYNWDDKAMVPYLTDSSTGEFAFGYENLRSLAIKCEYAISKGLKGCMYWSYGGDNAAGDLRRTVYQTLNKPLE